MNKNEAVEQWLAGYDNPMKALVTEVRDVILSADSRIEETIKWQAPTFVYKGNLASFFPKAKQHASLMFHKGKTIPGNYPSLEGDGKEARTMKFKDADDLVEKTAELQAIVSAWCDDRDR